MQNFGQGRKVTDQDRNLRDMVLSFIITTVNEKSFDNTEATMDMVLSTSRKRILIRCRYVLIKVLQCCIPGITESNLGELARGVGFEPMDHSSISYILETFATVKYNHLTSPELLSLNTTPEGELLWLYFVTASKFCPKSLRIEKKKVSPQKQKFQVKQFLVKLISIERIREALTENGKTNTFVDFFIEMLQGRCKDYLSKNRVKYIDVGEHIPVLVLEEYLELKMPFNVGLSLRLFIPVNTLQLNEALN